MRDAVIAERLPASQGASQRSPRFDLNLPLSFRTDDGLEEGHCVNVSASGMLAVFDRPVELFTVGEISMLAGEYVVNITGRVARVHDGDHGISFQMDTDNDRLIVEVLVEFAAANRQPKALQ